MRCTLRQLYPRVPWATSLVVATTLLQATATIRPLAAKRCPNLCHNRRHPRLALYQHLQLLPQPHLLPDRQPHPHPRPQHLHLHLRLPLPRPLSVKAHRRRTTLHNPATSVTWCGARRPRCDTWEQWRRLFGWGSHIGLRWWQGHRECVGLQVVCASQS